MVQTKEQKKECQQKWYRKNKDKESKRSKERYKNNIAEIRKQQREYYNRDDGAIYKKRKNSILQTNRRNKLKKLDLYESFTQEEWIDKLNKTEGICEDCKEPMGIKNLTLDHIIPISKAPKGFTYSIDDVQALCSFCNSSKGYKEKLQFEISNVV